MKRDMSDYIEAINLVAQLRKAKYNAHIKEGFTPEQALEICKGELGVNLKLLKKRKSMAKLKTKSSRRKTDNERKKTDISLERINQFERLLGRKWRGSLDNAHATTLGVLHDRGFITEAQRDAGLNFERLFKTFYPGADPRANSIGDLSGNGSICGPREATDEALAAMEERFRSDRAAIQTVPKAYDVVYDAVICGFEPDWLNRLIGLEGAHRQKIDIWAKLEACDLDPKTNAKKIAGIVARQARRASNVRESVEIEMTVKETEQFKLLTDGLQAIIEGRE